MEMKEVKSSNIKKIGHADDKLRVEFSSGGLYEYDDVPAEVFEGFIHAGSKGKYFHQKIRVAGYKYKRLDEPKKEKDDEKKN